MNTFDRHDVVTRVYTDWSKFQVLAVHTPTGLFTTHEEEYLGDSWVKGKEKAIQLLEEEYNQKFNRKERKHKHEKTDLPSQ